ncbi:MAG TPA: AAA family ATPase [Flavobacterium sp.]|uniref:AAA family ATPase n=1 Tax=unclassified Flavobacterium TaxID=196869 RepID=UPI0025C53521|nr:MULTISPECIES: AAA family ATPase [unclassified Flavobacterium]HRE78474.1 AAA family ATPase [Flavobacterium sp.]
MKQNLARLVTKESVLQALQKFEDSNPVLEKSTSYDLEYNGSYYPPKEVVREAARIQGIKIDNNKHSLGGGDKTNIPLKNLGFKIINKIQYHMNLDKLEKYWKDYKKYFELPKSEHQEKYKWGVLNQVYKKWDWNVIDIPEMFKNAFLVEGKKNLWESGNFYPIKHTLWMFENFKDETINEFKNLFDEQLELDERIKSFIDFYNLKLPELQKLVPDKKINYHSHKDFRAIALYLSLQYPKKYFLYKFTMFKNFSLKLELPKIKAGDYNNIIKFIDLSNEVLNFIKRDSDFINLYKEFTSEIENYDDDSLHLLTQDFIYTIANHFNDGKKYWRVGSNDGESSFFNQMLNDNYIAIGWNEIGDLEEQEIDDKKGVQQLLLNEGFNFKASNVLSRKAGEIYDFYSNASINDIVTLMDGNTVLAIGKIISDYNYEESKPFAHYRDVEWLKKEVSNYKITDGSQTTFYQLTNKDTLKKIEFELKNNAALIKINQMENKSNPSTSLNQILYGAPGTGKTYTTKKLAIEIIDNKTYNDSTHEERDIILNRYNELSIANQIHFTTFHQSMGYEDFIEGIKPKVSNNNISYEVKSGILKYFCENIIETQKLTEFNLVDTKLYENFDGLYTVFLKQLKKIISGLEKDEYHKFPARKSNVILLDIENEELITKGEKASSNEIIKKEKLKRIYEKFEKVEDIKDVVTDLRGVGTDIGWTTNYYAAFKALKDFESSLSNQSNINYHKKYVFIIDEINRGNVSAIFGELITLIEEDKRKGNKEEIEVVLPYSQDKFSVPNNLYIIGTMNTADRSVESLDTALRRRFSFVEMPSKPEKLIDIILKDAEDIDLVRMLEKINQRIELLIDKDHQIGHSFFINLKDFKELKSAFKNKIIPLLEEYFFGDFGKIGLVLGENFISVKNGNNNSGILAKFSAYEEVDFVTEKKVYQIKDCDELSALDFISIYE